MYILKIEDFITKPTDIVVKTFNTYLPGLPKNIVLDLSKQKLDKKIATELALIFKSIPPNVNSLNLSNNRLAELNDQELALILAAIPASVIALNLSGNGFSGDEASRKLAFALKSMPTSITSLNLSNNISQLQTVEQTVLIIGAIPSSVISLNFSSNNLDIMNSEELKKIFSIFPPSVTSLDLSRNYLGRVSGQLVEIFKNTPRTVVSLTLSHNNLGSKPMQLAVALKSLPPTVTSLNLSYNNLGTMTGKQLEVIFKSIPATVTSLDLSGNKFSKMNKEELALAFQSFPANVRSISWGASTGSVYSVPKKTGKGLVQLLAILPATVNSLDLSHYMLGDMNSEVLVSATILRFLAAIPKNVTSLNLSNNNFYNCSGEELATLFKTIPTSITELDLSNNALCRLSLSDLLLALQSIPTTVTRINLSKNMIFFNKTFAERDVLLSLLQSVEQNGRLILSHNDEPAFARALLPILSGIKQGKFPFDVASNILCRLLPAKNQVPDNVLLKSKIINSLEGKNTHLLENRFTKYGGFFKGDLSIEELKKQAIDHKDGPAHKTLQYFCIM